MADQHRNDDDAQRVREVTNHIRVSRDNGAGQHAHSSAGQSGQGAHSQGGQPGSKTGTKSAGAGGPVS